MTATIELQVDAQCQCPTCNSSLPADLALSSRPVICPECGHYLWCQKRMVNDVAVLYVLPEPTPELSEINHLVDSLGGVPRIVVDLSRFETVLSEFLGRLLMMQELVQHREGSLTICGLGQIPREIFALTKFDTLVELADDTEIALASL